MIRYQMSSVGAVYDRPFSLNHGKRAVTDRAYSGIGSRARSKIEVALSCPRLLGYC